MNTDIDPLQVGAQTGLLWRHADLVLAGVGVATRIPFERPEGANTAQRKLRELMGDTELDRPGVGPVAFAALPFDRERNGELIVPSFVVGQDGAGRRWLTYTGKAPFDPVEALRAVEQVLADSDDQTLSASSYSVESAMAPEAWRDELVAVARDAISAGELTKSVVSRRLTVTADEDLPVATIVQNLVSSFPTAVVFNVEGFVGASPELLVSRNEDMVHAHPLAGTAARSSDPIIDNRKIANLLASTKDRWEHKITIDWLLDTLLPFCSYVDAEPEPSIVTLANVHHLGTLVEGRLRKPHPSVLELVSALHPTPAVGGDPQTEALQLIDKLEGEDRGRYAGPTGWVDGRGNGAFVVAIRSAEIDGPTAELRAGVGVVADSDPASELEETRNKFKAMLGAILRP